MGQAIHVVCPACDQINRIAADRPMNQAVCGRCQSRLFEGRPIELDDARFEKHAARSDLPIIVDFWAPWCGPCRAMAPVFERAAQDLEPRARFVKVNVDDNPAAAARLGVRGIPALFALQHGTVMAQHAGMADAKLLASWVAMLSRRGT